LRKAYKEQERPSYVEIPSDVSTWIHAGRCSSR